MSKQVVAAFDFDGTLTTRDALLPFLLSVVGPTKTLFNLARQSPELLGFLCGCCSRQKTKEGVIRRFVGGMPHADLQQKGIAFAQEGIRKLLKPQAMKKLQWHQEQGHRCVLISASLDLFLVPWATREGFNDLICSRVEVDAKGQVTGRLVGLNCWGPEKARRLVELLGTREEFILYAYGDSRGDKELLQLADYPFYRTFW